ncbi:M14 family metallopeptidase [Rubrivirga litoralis]|uniref:M14 family metallopeptidase n=1 Tax=Rubrivirga litoralis TaxID=3075598 RepID=A0ABU3BMA4_9BACT|nr:M14 family metallopeptidase [Rubrivirga sp. F394]MDT0630422.1 M14 family metallopeptidase [Rubrivirga sp. F394]
MRFRLAPLAVLLVAGPALAQVPTPEAFLGYDLGERFTPHHRVVDYVEAVAAASPRVALSPYGETPEGRPLVTLVVAAEGTDVDAVRRSSLRATEGGAAPEKLVVWLSYNVHGNEAVSTEAALRTLYELTTPRADAWLRDVVVVLDPCLNPDGRERYVSGYRQRRGDAPDPSPEAWEHDEPWPGGRFNHYLFDLNRDWAWGTQPETRARLAVYNAWMPAVHVDFHEQGVDSPYYFAPAAEPFHPRVLPWQRAVQTEIGRANARVFDREGWLYFTREVFDLLYPGYGDTWPTFNGAVGMTYEQGGSGRAGLAIRTTEGDTLTLADRIRNHVATGLETVATVAGDADRVGRAFAAGFATPPAGPAVAFAARGDAGRLEALAALLDLQGIRYGWAGREQTARGVRYAGGLDRPAPPERLTVQPGDLVVSLDQPKGRLAAVLFEPEPALVDSVTYDVTAWALPYVYGVEGLALESAVDAGGAAPSAPLAPAAARPYAYVLPWESPQDARVLAELLREEVGVRVVPEPFEAEGRRFRRGSVVATRAGNGRLGERFDAVVREAAARAGRPAVALGTGFATSGADLGSNRVGFARGPRVAVLTDEPVAPTALGEVWHWFDRVVDYPATLLRADGFSRADLDDADVLVLPDGRYGAWLTDDRAEALRGWVRAGGRLVAMEGAARAFAGKDGFGIATREAPAPDSTADGRLRRYGDREREGVSGGVPGAVYRVALDETHPLAYGYPDHTYVVKQGTSPVDFLADGWNVGVLRSGTPAAGFAGRRAQDRLTDSLVFGVEDLGDGEVVYLLDTPIFRGFWADGQLLFANAVFGLGAE